MDTASDSFPITGRAAEALRFINTTAAHVFLTGKAGTGKTTFLKSLGRHTHKNFLVVAPTGIAALNAGGVTIHSQFRLPFGMFLPERTLPEFQGARFYNERFLAENSPLDRVRRQLLRSIDLLVIDEVSMLRADLLDAIDNRLRSARGQHHRAFGGVQVLFIGDLFQLPPVTKREDQEILSKHYASPWFFEARALQRERLVYIELDKIYRQQDDRFIGLLNRLRNNEVTSDDLEEINSRYRPGTAATSDGDTITLTTHNQQADDINQRALNSLPGKPAAFTARTTGDFPESMYPVAFQLMLKEGAQIMFTRNDHEGKVYFNGRIARITDLSEDGIVVRFRDSNEEYRLQPATWENKRFVTDPDTMAIREEVIGTFEQFPVRLAWAITIHKSQGLTFDRAVIDPGRAFADGQVYVALSRLRSLDGLSLSAPLRQQSISTDPVIVQFTRHIDGTDTLDETVRQKQREFIGQEILHTFDFDALTRELESGLRSVPTGSIDPDMAPFVNQALEVIRQEQSEIRKSREALIGLLDGDRFDQLLHLVKEDQERFARLLWALMGRLLGHSAQADRVKRGQGYKAWLAELEPSLLRKIEELGKVALLIGSVVTGKDQPDTATLRASILSKRIEILGEIRQADDWRQAGKKPAKGRKRKGN